MGSLQSIALTEAVRRRGCPTPNEVKPVVDEHVIRRKPFQAGDCAQAEISCEGLPPCKHHRYLGAVAHVLSDNIESARNATGLAPKGLPRQVGLISMLTSQ